MTLSDRKRESTRNFRPGADHFRVATRPGEAAPIPRRIGTARIRTVSLVALVSITLLLANSCATTIRTSIRNDSALGVESFGAVEVGDLRNSDVVSRTLVSRLREKGFRVDKGFASDEVGVSDKGAKLGADALIYGYVVRIEHDSWVTRGEERVRVRETSYGTKETIRYDPPEVISSKTIHVRIRALDGAGEKVILDTEGYISDDEGADTAYMIESIVKEMLEQLPPPRVQAVTSLVPQQPQGVAVGVKAPDFMAKTISGERVTLSDYIGKKVVVLNFWGVRCLPCLQEMPKLEDIYSRYKSQGVEMLGVNVDGVGPDIIRKSLRKQLGGVSLNVTYPLLLDEDFAIIDAYYLTVAPLTAVIDKDGVIRYLHIDYLPGDEIELENAIKAVLN